MPALAVVAVCVAVLAPSTATQLTDRVKANPLTDHSVRWRLAGIHAVLAGMKNGEWDTRSGLLTSDASGNHLINSSFEFGTTGWQVQGGGIFTVPTVVPGFGQRSLMLRTNGLEADEGWYSSPVVAKAGQTWLYTVWLEGQVGGEQVNVSIWEYNDREEAIHRAELPAVLTPDVQQFAVKTTISDPEVTHIRVLVRTKVPQRATLFGDLATLRLVTAPLAHETHAITTYNSDGAVLSPTIRGDGSSAFGDNQANYAVTGPDLLPNGSFEEPSPLGGVQDGTLTQVNGFSRSLGPSSASSDKGDRRATRATTPTRFVSSRARQWSFSVWLQGAQQGGEEMLVGMWLYTRDTLQTPGRQSQLLRDALGPPGRVHGHRSRAARACPLRPRSRSGRVSRHRG